MTRSERRAVARREGKAAICFVPPSNLPTAEAALRFLQAGDAVRAEAECRRVLETSPRDVLSRQILGVIAYQRGDAHTARDFFASVIELDPTNPDGYNNLGEALNRLEGFADAVPIFQRAIELNPSSAPARLNYSRALGGCGRFGEAIAAGQEALALEPRSVPALQNLGVAYWESGDLPQAIDALQRAVALEPTNTAAWSSLLMFLQYSPDHTADDLLATARAWGRTMDRPVVGRPVASIPEPARLRVGYVSGDLRGHPVGYQIEKVLAGHDRARVEVVLYSTSPLEDDLTERLKGHAIGWRNVTGLDDASAARQIAADGVHVLIDLSGHTAAHRLGIFAYRPAPVQATWLGYFGTTGLPQMDFILRDPAQIPACEGGDYTERFQPLADASFGYTPAAGCPEVSPLPARTNGHVTFGCFNNLAKITDGAIAAWARILHAVPGARMRIDRKGLDDPSVRDRFLSAFAERGIAADRLTLSATRGQLAYLNLYREVDVVLDTFPCNGGTTTYEALWMGVPVVSRRWGRMVGHFAESILGPCGHADWVADDEDGYVATAVALAGDLDALASLRAGLRQALADSPLCQAGDCAKSLENAFEAMWRQVKGPAAPVSQAEIEAYQMQAVAAFQAEDVALAERIFRRVTHLAPDLADGHNNLGVALRHQGRIEAAVASFERAIALKPDYAAAYGNLGGALACHGRYEEALLNLTTSLKLDPSVAQYWLDMAAPLAQLGQFAQAFTVLERGAGIDSALATAFAPSLFSQIGDAFATQSKFPDAIACFTEATLAFAAGANPAAVNVKAHYEVAYRLQHAGRVEEAIEWYRKALQLDPHYGPAQSNLAWCLQYSDRHSLAEVYEWATLYAKEHAPTSLARNPQPLPREGRRLRVGYLSPEFREHPVAYSMEPLLACHDREAFEIFVYANVGKPDAMTKKLQSMAEHWRDVASLNDDQAADLIQNDRLDVLVDLAGYTENNRAGVFARKPAPVQAQWLGYYATLGMPQMDYFIVNPALIPSEEERFYVERPMRLEGRAFALKLPDVDLPVTPLPALTGGHVTFGCHNYLAKVTPEVVRVWSEVLKAVPGSRLRLNRQALIAPATQARYRAMFESHGIDASRVDFLATFSRDEHLKTLGQCDVMLDTFPFNGGTVTYEALWMGLPVVTMVTPGMVGHFGESILTPLGHGDWVARTETEYVAKAVALTSDLPRLAEIRAGLRDALAQSPLCDSPAFTREIEDAFRRMVEEASSTHA